MTDRYLGLRINDIGQDDLGRLVQVINCRCVLPHGSTEEYRAAHGDGCLYRPSEGLVLTLDGDRVTGWGPEDIFERALAPVSAARVADVKSQMAAKLDEVFRRRPVRSRRIKR